MKRSQLKRVSKKTKLAQDVFYKVTKPLWLALHPACQYQGEGSVQCGETYGVTVHHRMGRGKQLNELKFFMTVCQRHHRWIEDNKKEARRRGYVLYK